MEKRFLVVRPAGNNWGLWRLTPAAEARVGQIGIQSDSMLDFYQQTQRLLTFDDGTAYWYYPCWLKRQKKEVQEP